MNNDTTLTDDTRLLAGFPAVYTHGYWAIFLPHRLQIIRVDGEHLNDELIRDFIITHGLSLPNCAHRCGSVGVNLTLVTTRACNLRCKYCFLGESKTETMSHTLGLAAVEYAIEQAIDRGQNVNVSYFGGEPTLNWSLIETTAELLASSRVQSNLHVTTNGIISQDMCSFFRDLNFSVTVSNDGIPEYNDKVRVFANGAGTSGQVQQTLANLVRLGVSFKVRMTVTAGNVETLPNAVAYYADLGVRFLHIEPMNSSQMQNDRTLAQPKVADFIRYLTHAFDVAREKGVEIINSAFIRLVEPRECYCDAASGNRLIILPDGTISRCFEVQSSCHPEWDLYAVGRFDTRAKRPLMFSDAMSLPVRPHECEFCFSRYICAGGCPVRNSYNQANYFCQIRRALLRDVIIRMDADGNSVRSEVNNSIHRG
ncbi:radical SAM/SPASM domain-containing protein [Limnospira fusiformis]|uniref:radical SAM/SPASM domain-containing protein n=1 Tax=Limnospira fusiformis TaxID=54297 RepID=UPI001448EEA0|nr:radical SAM protein [Limnospira fusiformis SAG 85.79]